MKKSIVQKESIALLCNSSPSHGCPEVFENATAAEPQQIQIKDDFGGLARMSRAQFSVLLKRAKQGRLDRYLET